MKTIFSAAEGGRHIKIVNGACFTSCSLKTVGEAISIKWTFAGNAANGIIGGLQCHISRLLVNNCIWCAINHVCCGFEDPRLKGEKKGRSG